MSSKTDSIAIEAMKILLECFLASRKKISKMLGRMVRPDEIEDIVQETFVLSYAASRNQKIRNPQAFMMRVARNIALDHISRASSKNNCSIEEIDESTLISDLDTELRYQSEERFLEFCRAVAVLPTNCRRAFILKKVYGLSLAEISQQMNLSTSTVEKHVAKGLMIVIEHMDNHREDRDKEGRKGNISMKTFKLNKGDKT